jgi:hypothetical protein
MRWGALIFATGLMHPNHRRGEVCRRHSRHRRLRQPDPTALLALAWNRIMESAGVTVRGQGVSHGSRNSKVV